MKTDQRRTLNIVMAITAILSARPLRANESNLEFLKRLERRAIQKSPSVQAAIASAKKTGHGTNKALFSLGPTLDFITSHANSKSLKDEGQKQDRHQNTLELRQNIPSYWQVKSTLDSKHFKHQQAELAVKTEKQSVLEDLRSDLIQLLIQREHCHIKGNIYQANQDIYNLSNSRYRQGFINQRDLLRVDLSRQTYRAKYQQCEQKTIALESKVKLKVGNDPSTLPHLKTPNLASLITKVEEAMRRIDRLQDLGVQSALVKEQLESVNSFQRYDRFMPQISLVGRKVLDERDEFVLETRWNIFSSGRDASHFKEGVASKEQARESKNQSLLDYKIWLQEAQGELSELRARLSSAQDRLALSQKILKSTRKDYQKGLASSRSVMEDLKSVLENQEMMLSLQEDLAKLAIKVDGRTGNSQLFYDFF